MRNAVTFSGHGPYLEGYLAINYTEAPPPALTDEEQQWVETQLHRTNGLS